MRKNYFFTLLLTLCLTGFSFGQTTLFSESFETGNSGTASQDCNDGSADFFTRTDGSDIGSFYQVTGQDGNFFFAAMDLDGSPCTMATSTLEFNDIDITGATNLNFAILLAEDQAGDDNEDWDSSDGFLVEYDIDNSGSYTTLIDVNSNGVTTNGEPTLDGVAITDVFAEFIRSIPETGSEIDIRLTFTLNSGDEDIAIDNIRLVDGAITSPPSLAITGVSNGAVLSPETTEVPVAFSIQNFTLSGDSGGGVSDGSGDGYITTVLQESGETDENASFFTTMPTPINVVAGRTYTATAELVDNSGNSLTPAVTASVTFSVATYTQVADIAALRAGTEGDYYELTGEAIYTFEGTSRNQKYIQDGTAAILIDDDNGIITTSYNIGDGITGIKGRLSSFSGVMQFVPQVDPGAASSNGNTIPMQTVTVAQMNANLDDYESEFVTIDNVDFVDADGSATFSSGSNYDITDGTNTMVFRVHFSGTDIDGTLIPYSSANITGIAGEFAGNSQIFGIDLANIVLGVQTNEIEGYSAYPNPVKGNGLTITTSSADKKTVAIYNVLGRRVFTQSFTGTRETLNVSNISSGIYILKVTEGNKISTQKLIIE